MTTSTSGKPSDTHRLAAVFKLVIIPLAVAFVAWGGHTYFKNRAAQQAEDSRRYALAFERLLTLHSLATDYAAAHGNTLPPTQSWEDALRPYAAKQGMDISQLVISPLRPGPRRFAMNTALSNFDMDNLKSSEAFNLILFFDSVAPDPNAADNMTSLSQPADDAETALVHLSPSVEVYQGAMGKYAPGGSTGLTAAGSIEISREAEKAIAARQKNK